MLNKNIQNLRKAKGLSQEELAEQLNVVRQTISKWEKGLSVPDAVMLSKLASALDTTVTTLLGTELPDTNDSDTLLVLSQKLSALNEQYSQKQTIRRRHWRTLWLILIILAAFVLITNVIQFIYTWQANATLQSDTSIIGGADAATHIYLSAINPQWLSIVIATLTGAVAIFGLHSTRK